MGGYDDAEHAPVRVARHARRQPAGPRGFLDSARTGLPPIGAPEDMEDVARLAEPYSVEFPPDVRS